MPKIAKSKAHTAKDNRYTKTNQFKNGNFECINKTRITVTKDSKNSNLVTMQCKCNISHTMLLSPGEKYFDMLGAFTDIHQ